MRWKGYKNNPTLKWIKLPYFEYAAIYLPSNPSFINNFVPLTRFAITRHRATLIDSVHFATDLHYLMMERSQEWCTHNVSRAPLGNRAPKHHVHHSAGLKLTPVVKWLKQTLCCHCLCANWGPPLAVDSYIYINKYISKTHMTCGIHCPATKTIKVVVNT